MKILPVIYLGYMFVSIYLLFLFTLLYYNNKKHLFDFPETKKKYSISVIVPCWNEEKTVQNTIDSIFEIDYPIKEVFVINDGSTDKTREIVEGLLKKYPKLNLINKENSGKGDSINQGIKLAKGELIVVVDADSYPAKDSFGKMVGYFDDEKVGAATCIFVPRNRSKFFEKLQVIEYNMIALTRKLLGFVDAIYVTPGPLAMYRKSVLEEIGGFDAKNITEDIEIAWHINQAGYKIRMCLSTSATTTAPDKIKAWYRQRRRWGVGGLQCIEKYRKEFFKKGMLGMFIVPFFIIQFFLGVLGLSVFFYLFVTKVLSNFLFVTYSVSMEVPLLTMESLHITPSFLNYLGIILFIFSFAFTLVILSVMKDSMMNKQNIFNILFFSIVYLTVYPFITISSIYNYLKKDKRWK